MHACMVVANVRETKLDIYINVVNSNLHRIAVADIGWQKGGTEMIITYTAAVGDLILSHVGLSAMLMITLLEYFTHRVTVLTLV